MWFAAATRVSTALRISLAMPCHAQVHPHLSCPFLFAAGRMAVYLYICPAIAIRDTEEKRMDGERIRDAGPVIVSTFG